MQNESILIMQTFLAESVAYAESGYTGPVTNSVGGRGSMYKRLTLIYSSIFTTDSKPDLSDGSRQTEER